LIAVLASAFMIFFLLKKKPTTMTANMGLSRKVLLISQEKNLSIDLVYLTSKIIAYPDKAVPPVLPVNGINDLFGFIKVKIKFLPAHLSASVE
jgi:hypothetical protein